MSFKLDPAAVPDLPLPRPLYEVWVYSPRCEGVHLRGGRIARGGIRWSDRREDFRTEVLGLMKAQMVKNAVIVPVGAKGGFVVKKPPATADRDALQAEVEACYQILIRGMLDLTDNIVGGDGRATHARRAIRRRRSLPRRRGRQGHRDVLRPRELDRRRVRLLARRRVRLGRFGRLRPQGDGHHRPRRVGVACAGTSSALGINPDKDPLHSRRHRRHVRATCSATGCCSHMRCELVGAFDHRHVFVDPTPDPAASFVERKRLFDLPRSSWDDYDRSLISAGGGVWPARAKSIALSPQARELLCTDADGTHTGRRDLGAS